MASALARRGLGVAVVPRQWALAAAGVDVVIGARGAAWAPCPQLGVAIVDRRARRDPAGGAQPDVARARRRDRAGPTRRCTRALDHAVPDSQWCRCRRRLTRPPAGRRGTGRLADRRHRRPQRRGAVANVAAVVGVDPAASTGRPRGLRAQHHRPGAHPRLPDVPLLGSLHALRRCSWARRRRAGWCAPAAARTARRCARSVAGLVSPTSAPASPDCARSWRRPQGGPSSPSPDPTARRRRASRGLRRHGGGAPPRRPRRCCRLPRFRPRAPGAALPGR